MSTIPTPPPAAWFLICFSANRVLVEAANAFEAMSIAGCSPEQENTVYNLYDVPYYAETATHAVFPASLAGAR